MIYSHGKLLDDSNQLKLNCEAKQLIFQLKRSFMSNIKEKLAFQGNNSPLLHNAYFYILKKFAIF